MRARTYILASLASFGVLGVGIGTGVEAQVLTHGSTTTTTGAAPASTTAAAPATESSSSTPSNTTSSTSATSSGLKDGTYTGAAASTRYGNVQVQITVKDGKVTAANATEYPNEDPRDQQINEYAVPILNSEVTSSQSANISQVSGATFTSEGYVTSLQAALEAAQA